MQEVMTTKQLADYLQVKESTVKKKIKEGRIPAIKLGRAWRFKKSVIDKWLEKEATSIPNINYPQIVSDLATLQTRRQTLEAELSNLTGEQTLQ